MDALPEDIFERFKEWQAFVMEHEYQHSLVSRQQFEEKEGKQHKAAY